MNNLQLVNWAIARGELTIHEPSIAYPFYTLTMEGKAVSHRDFATACDMACAWLRCEVLVQTVVQPGMAR